MSKGRDVLRSLRGSRNAGSFPTTHHGSFRAPGNIALRFWGCQALNHNILRLSCRAIAISGSLSHPTWRRGNGRQASKHPVPGSEQRSSARSEGGRESLFSVSPECTGRMNRGIVPHHFRCGTGNFQSALEKAGSVPRGRRPTVKKTLIETCDGYLDQTHLEWSPADEDEDARALNGQALHTQASYLPRSSAARVAALSASVAAKMRFRSFKACSACSLKRFDCSYCARLSALRRE